MKGKLLLTALAAASVLLGACTTYPVQDPYYDQPVVRVGPPPPQYEYYGSPPSVGYVWISGYWNWGGVRYIWVPGRWDAPRPGHYWVPHRWERQGDHWRQHGGRWEQDSRSRQEYRPAPPVVRPPVHSHPQGQIIQRSEPVIIQRVDPPGPGIHRPEPAGRDYRRHESGPTMQRPEPGPAYQPPQQRPPAQERSVAPSPGNERESRRPPAEGSEVRSERRSEPRIERDSRPPPVRNDGPRSERDDRQRSKKDGNDGQRRRGPDDE
ncbi:MAG: YXWGXW repeat-containing protein [Gammaproteobacteria bacterium]|nr:hypothetical protein [Rhodocyclaceae bacterium]MBU3910583.1 YXWGXW repeat-containing protein [Gammaproteobacteria bacterium]MBU3989236.1 YXWGXW repeat-containing protein [Gammaproteobacteria bacterium]MBU4005064.1 YXWGXW repeat-containing protein [Gammaproteobacteria bacterium]MBU4020657.1 YXWGXW repeat-containing protein [Gammaproteobacteria bacterium]